MAIPNTAEDAALVGVRGSVTGHTVVLWCVVLWCVVLVVRAAAERGVLRSITLPSVTACPDHVHPAASEAHLDQDFELGADLTGQPTERQVGDF